MSGRIFKRMVWLLLTLAALTGQGCNGGGPVAGDIVSTARIASVTKEAAAAIFAAAGVPVVPAYAVEIHKIVYLTTDESGALVSASGALVVPQDLAAPAPLLSYQHGTTTLKFAVASTAPAAGQPYSNLEALAFGSSGYVTALPDYLGYGDSGNRFHPYLHAQTLAAAVVDLLRGARSFCTTNNIPLSNKLFLTGYSEGGYATMAATREIQEKYSGEFSLTASAPMAGPYDLSASLLAILNRATYPSPAFISFAFWAYDRTYALNLLDQEFQPPFAGQLDSLFDGSQDIAAVNLALPTDLATLFQNQFLIDFRGTGAALLKTKIEENNLHNWIPTVAMRLIHCTGDDIVSFQNSQTAFNNFNRNGASSLVQLVAPTPDGNHVTCAGPAILAAKSWFDTLK